ncbi:hypothetical protein [Actinomadura alba]|uniref:Uncharacterized protein n=1 Tax=Actinomadura alba TaxID=406431 RepID=A0ABR7M2C9_9ACTN|nr:hypothetical protein [Actinomadura alba]MBC6471277.1 hypothetical protein [Actinomadura alba]
MGTSAGGFCVWLAVGVLGGSERVAEGVDGLALEAESEVSVDGGGDADVGVTEKFSDHDEFNTLLEGRVAAVCLRS